MPAEASTLQHAELTQGSTIRWNTFQRVRPYPSLAAWSVRHRGSGDGCQMGVAASATRTRCVGGVPPKGRRPSVCHMPFIAPATPGVGAARGRSANVPAWPARSSPGGNVDKRTRRRWSSAENRSRRSRAKAKGSPKRSPSRPFTGSCRCRRPGTGRTGTSNRGRVGDPGVDGSQDPDDRPEEVLLILVVAGDVRDLDGRHLRLRENLEAQANLSSPASRAASL